MHRDAPDRGPEVRGEDFDAMKCPQETPGFPGSGTGPRSRVVERNELGSPYDGIGPGPWKPIPRPDGKPQ